MENEHFFFCKISNCKVKFQICRHGYPDDARCMAYDPVQKLLAIGTGHGIVRMIGMIFFIRFLKFLIHA